MSRLEKHIEKKEDNYSIGSKAKLKAAMRHKIKRTFVGCLDALEQELGVPFSKEELEIPSNKEKLELFNSLRSKILSLGNDQIRNMETEMDKYNIEFIPYHIKLRPLGDTTEEKKD